MHLADAFIQSDLQLHPGYTFSLVHVFPGNRTHNLLRNRRNALPLSHTGTFFLKLFGLRGHRHCPHKPPSCCNNHVIIHICVLINHIQVHLHELEFRESSFFLLTYFKK